MHKKYKRYIITAALPYANGPIHIGHLAGVYLPADILSRYLRCKKKDIIFISGSDEHGVPIKIKAIKEKINPKKIIDKYHYMIKKNLKKFDISFDNYSRTSNKIHHETASNFFKKLNKNKILIKKKSFQYYDEKLKEFLPDRYIIGICPYCYNKKAYGDQCEKCGSPINPEELIKPKSILSGNIPILKKTKHWYLPLNKYEKFINNWIIKKHKKDWKNNVYSQVKSWMKKGLKPRAITRDIDWGIPVPIKKNENKVLYVWFEAPIGYISSTIEWAKKKGKNWEKYWKSNNTALIQFIGKDNIFFHCIIFPIMIKAHGDIILPTNIPANEFLNLENKKISTSNKWGVWLHEYLNDLPDKQDALRYILIINMPEKKDNNFTWNNFKTRFNSELVSILGNFIHRSLILCKKHFKKIIPKNKYLIKKDKEILKKIKIYPNKIGKLIEKYKFRESLKNLLELARIGNKYLTEEKPWEIYLKKPKRISSIIYTSLQIVGMISNISYPFLPRTSKKIQKMLNISKTSWDKLKKTEILISGHKINTPKLIFTKITNNEIKNQIKKLKKNQ